LAGSGSRRTTGCDSLNGQSTWNLENLFTGWHDVDLSDLGRQDAVRRQTEKK